MRKKDIVGIFSPGDMPYLINWIEAWRIRSKHYSILSALIRGCFFLFNEMYRFLIRYGSLSIDNEANEFVFDQEMLGESVGVNIEEPEDQ